MKKQIIAFSAFLTILFLTACSDATEKGTTDPIVPPPAPHPEARRDTIYPEASDEAFRNPMKGWRDFYAWGANHVRAEWPEPYGSVIKEYMPWDSLELVASDGVERIIAYSNKRWAGYAEKNIKVIPRVYLDFPVYGSQGDIFDPSDPHAPKPGSFLYYQHWPTDLDKWDYTSEAFRERVKKLIEKIGVAWDNDPRVAYVEIGIIGQWGEHHTPDLSGTWASIGLPDGTYPGYPAVMNNLTDLIQVTPLKECWAGDFNKKTAYIEGMEKLLGDAFSAAFHQKKVMTRNAGEMLPYSFGVYWDAWSLDNVKEDNQYDNIKARSAWRSQPIGGEIAFTGFSSAGAMLNHMEPPSGGYRWRILRAIRTLHCNHLGGITWDNFNQEPFKTQAAEVQKLLGYRFIIKSFDYPLSIYTGEPFSVHFTVQNIGSSPFYYNWPVELSLIDSETGEKVWGQTLDGVDITQWMPGDKLNSAVEPIELWRDYSALKWEVSSYFYENQAKEYEVSATVTPSGEFSSEKNYYIALSVLDPAGNLPSLRFAIKNYLKGGYHPMGCIVVDQEQEPAFVEIPTSAFSSLQEDTSLHYLAP